MYHRLEGVKYPYEDNLMWKKEGTTLVSKYKGAILGVDKETKLVGIFDKKEMITPVSIDEAASSNSKLSVPCKNYFRTDYVL